MMHGQKNIKIFYLFVLTNHTYLLYRIKQMTRVNITVRFPLLTSGHIPVKETKFKSV
jgi:hypothetical protein